MMHDVGSCIETSIRATHFPGSIDVHTEPEEFKNAALFLRLGLPSTRVRHENGGFNTPFKLEEFENAGFHFEDGALRNDDLL